MTTPGGTTPLTSATWTEPPLSWPAIFAGAVVGLAASLVLTTAAAGIGYAFAPFGVSTRSSLAGFSPTVGAAAIAVQVIAAAFGGFVAGRTRSIWSSVHDHEAHFRDTAHGLIAWAVATLGGVVLASLVLAPYAAQMAGREAAGAPLTAAETVRASNIAAQSALFLSIGMLLSALVSAVAARLGGVQHATMHAKMRG